MHSLLTSMAPNALGSLITSPRLFAKCLADLLNHSHEVVQKRMLELIEGIKGIMCLPNKEEINIAIKMSLLRILQ